VQATLPLQVRVSTEPDRREARSAFTGDNNILIKAESVRALGHLFLKAGLLTVTLPNDRYTLPIGPSAIASFASFKSIVLAPMRRLQVKNRSPESALHIDRAARIGAKCNRRQA